MPPNPVELHERNRSFEWGAPSGPYRLIDASQAESWSRDGFFVVENAFDADTLQALLAVIDPAEEQVDAFLATRPGQKFLISEAGNITFTTHLVARAPEARAFCSHPVFQDLAHDLIGPDVRLYWDQAVYKKPERPSEFPWHQDNGYTYVEPQQYLTCWVALNDASVANGCPWVVPGLHRKGTLRHWVTDAGYCCLEDPEGAIPVPASAGSIVVFSSLTPHRTGPNTSDGVRKAYIVQFAPDGAVARRDGQPPLLQNDDQRQFPILSKGVAV